MRETIRRNKENYRTGRGESTRKKITQMRWCSAEWSIIHRYIFRFLHQCFGSRAFRVCHVKKREAEIEKGPINVSKYNDKKMQTRERASRRIHSIFWIGILQYDYRSVSTPNSGFSIKKNCLEQWLSFIWNVKCNWMQITCWWCLVNSKA